ncbi:MAG: hydrolase TatD, partial [Myxococcaceae bacterium]|nr:hydrolase TatD [Myxococcaceae bacterium]
MFDARLDAEGLSDPDLETLRVFGIRGGLVTPRWGTAPHEAADATERFLREQAPRLERAGLEVVTSAEVPL